MIPNVMACCLDVLSSCRARPTGRPANGHTPWAVDGQKEGEGSPRAYTHAQFASAPGLNVSNVVSDWCGARARPRPTTNNLSTDKLHTGFVRRRAHYTKEKKEKKGKKEKKKKKKKKGRPPPTFRQKEP